MSQSSSHIVKELFTGLAKGNEACFRQIFDLYRSKIYYAALKMTRDPHDAEEIVQEVFLKVWQHQAKFSTVDEPENYLFMILYNNVRTWMSKVSRDEKLMVRLIQSLHGQENANDAEDQVILQETNRIINEAVAGMPSQRRLIFQLSRTEGLSHDEIADHLKISRHTVRNQIVEALRTLRQTFGSSLPLLLFILWNG